MDGFDWSRIWAPDWSLLEVAFRASVVYLVVQLLLRVVGRKELGRYSVHSLALLFLISTAVRQSITGGDTSVTTALIALTCILAWDWLFSYLAFRLPRFADLVDGPVERLVRDGAFCERSMRRARISRELLEAHVREQGRGDVAEIKDAYLERSGRITLIFGPRPQAEPP